MAVKASATITLTRVDDGTGIESLTTEYYLSTSKTELADGEWSSEKPTWTSGTYLWIRNKIVYKDPESTEYTEPYCDGTWEAIENAQTSANEANEATSDTAERLNNVEATLGILNDALATLVTDGNGMSLMTQTETGWTFNIAEIQNAVDSASDSLNVLQETLGNTNATVDTLNQAVKDFGETAEYIEITEYEDEPCIQLGESDSDFKLLITNTRIMFMEGSDVPTYISNKGLVTKNIEVENELKQGGFIWKIHGSGNLGLIWKGDEE